MAYCSCREGSESATYVDVANVVTAPCPFEALGFGWIRGYFVYNIGHPAEQILQ